MTDRLYPTSPVPNADKGSVSLPETEDLGPLLAPATLIPASDIVRDRTLIPDVAGIYGWWFDTPLPGVPLEGTLAIGEHRLLYVGIAPRKPGAAGSISKSTLRKRITRNHLGNRIGSSTLRRSLAALLRDELKLEFPDNSDRPLMPPEHEGALTNWMKEHAAVSILDHRAAWEIEDSLVASDDVGLPLNLKGSNHRFVSTLRAARDQRYAQSTTILKAHG